MGRVMVVDDEADMRMALRLFLQNGGHEVTEAENGEDALAQLSNGTTFDLILLDMRMPGLDGVQTLGKIRESHKDLPVIMVTGYGSTDSASEVLAQGASGYISKPFEHQELRDAMARAGLQETAKREEGGEKREIQRRTVLIGAVSLVVLLSSLFVVSPGLFTNREFKIAYSNPVDMTWNAGALWVADWYTQSIYVHNLKKSGAPIVKTYYLPEVHLSGVAVAGDRLFTTDSWKQKINRHKLDEYLTVEASLPSPGPNPASLFFDGKYLWSIDSKAGNIYQHRLDDKLTIVADFKAPGSAPVGFYKDDQFAWVSDSQTRRLYKLRLDDQLTPVGSYTLEDLEARREPLACFRWIDGNLWFARDRLAVLFKRTPRSLKPAK